MQSQFLVNAEPLYSKAVIFSMSSLLFILGWHFVLFTVNFFGVGRGRGDSSKNGVRHRAFSQFKLVALINRAFVKREYFIFMSKF